MYLVAGIGACGGDSTDLQSVGTSAARTDLDPCGLLTASQVEAVLPGADNGFTAASGRELMEGVQQYQCTYSDAEPNLFLVAFDIAGTDQQYRCRYVQHQNPR